LPTSPASSASASSARPASPRFGDALETRASSNTRAAYVLSGGDRVRAASSPGASLCALAATRTSATNAISRRPGGFGGGAGLRGAAAPASSARVPLAAAAADSGDDALAGVAGGGGEAAPLVAAALPGVDRAAAAPPFVDAVSDQASDSGDADECPPSAPGSPPPRVFARPAGGAGV
jgi:hypothetical protein